MLRTARAAAGRARSAAGWVANRTSSTVARARTVGLSSGGGASWKKKAAIGGGVGAGGIMAGRVMGSGRAADKGPHSLYGPQGSRGQFY